MGRRSFLSQVSGGRSDSADLEPRRSTHRATSKSGGLRYQASRRRVWDAPVRIDEDADSRELPVGLTGRVRNELSEEQPSDCKQSLPHNRNLRLIEEEGLNIDVARWARLRRPRAQIPPANESVSTANKHGRKRRDVRSRAIGPSS